jgi:hypothetical protein
VPLCSLHRARDRQTCLARGAQPGAIVATREAVNAFDGPGGSAINFSTISSMNTAPNSVVHSASKSATDAITKAQIAVS